MPLKSLKHLLSLLSMVSAVAGITPRALEKRQFQTDAVCDTSYVWASNSKQQTPCIVAAYVNGACGTNTYKVTKLLDGNRYNAPNASTANPCSCSWASYNLLSACTACQNMAQSIPTWDAWIYQCGSFLSNTYFPPGITLASGTSIPYYAGTNPTSWPNHQFDVVQAKATASDNHGDLSPNDQSQGSKPPVGPIVGGVVGGVVIIAIAAAMTAWLVHRRRKRDKEEPQHFDPTPTPFGMGSTPHPAPTATLHLRSLSDMSQKSLTNTAYLSSTSPGSPIAPSLVMTHISAPSVTHYANSESAFTEFGMNHPPSVYSSPSPPPLPQNSSVVSREHIIEPYRLISSVNSHARTESRTEKSGVDGYPVYDSPSSPPGIPPVDQDPMTPPRRRMNPPAYTPPEPSSSPHLLSHVPGFTAPSGPSEGPSAWTSSPSAMLVDGKGRRLKTKGSISSRRDDSSVMSPSPTVITGSEGFADDQTTNASVAHGSQFGERDVNAASVGGQTVTTGNSGGLNRFSSSPQPSGLN